MLDLSYNNVSADSVQSIGGLPRLKVLHLTGNDLHRLPPNMGFSGPDAVKLLVPHSPSKHKDLATVFICLNSFFFTFSLNRYLILEKRGEKKHVGQLHQVPLCVTCQRVMAESLFPHERCSKDPFI